MADEKGGGVFFKKKETDFHCQLKLYKKNKKLLRCEPKKFFYVFWVPRLKKGAVINVYSSVSLILFRMFESSDQKNFGDFFLFFSFPFKFYVYIQLSGL